MEGSQKAGGSERKLADACERIFRTLSSIRRSRSPRSSDGDLKVVESTLISTKGIVINLHLGEGGLPQGCLARGTMRAESGSDGAILDELMWDVTLLSTDAKEGQRSSHGRFRSRTGFRYIDYSQMVTND